jgi:hypothetical protein
MATITRSVDNAKEIAAWVPGPEAEEDRSVQGKLNSS